MGRTATASPEEIRNTIAAVALGLLLSATVFVSALRAKPADAHAAEPTRGLPTPVPMNPEPTGSPLHEPPAFPGLLSQGGRTTLLHDDEERIVERARKEIDRVIYYDASWMMTSGYPMGDVPANRGACTDVVVRALRAVNIDLQELVHEDILAEPGAYGIREPQIDANIDHRRVTSLMVFFLRHAMALPIDVHEKDSFRPGDVVFYAWSWTRGAPPEHVGIVSDKIGPRGLPLVIQNGGPKPVETDSIDRGRLIGHFRALPKPKA